MKIYGLDPINFHAETPCKLEENQVGTGQHWFTWKNSNENDVFVGTNKEKAGSEWEDVPDNCNRV